MEKVWYVICSGSTRIMKHRFSNFTEAIECSKGFADRNPGQEYVIFESVGGFKSVIKECETTMMNFEDQE